MANLADRPTQVEDITALANAKHLRHHLTEENFTIVSIDDYHDERGQFNAIAVVEIDLYPKVTIPMARDTRYMRKRIPFNRVDLKKSMVDSGFTPDKFGRFKIDSVADVDAFVSAVAEKINVDPKEVSFVKVGDTLASVRVKASSLGLTGQITVTTEDPDGEPEVPEQRK